MFVCQLQKATQDGAVSTEAMKEVNTMATDISFEIIRHIGVISTESNGFRRELNLVHWNNSPKGPVYDCRAWNEEHSRMTRGITLSREEATKLGELLRDAI